MQPLCLIIIKLLIILFFEELKSIPIRFQSLIILVCLTIALTISYFCKRIDFNVNKNDSLKNKIKICFSKKYMSFNLLVLGLYLLTTL